MKNFNIALVTLGLIALMPPKISSATLAFPGAEGFGSNTRGAYSLYEQTADSRDLPQVIHVTNLNDSGAGSFRNAVMSNGPRIILFDTGGVIQLQDQILVEGKPYVTIAGQTAPGDGIVLKGGRFEFRNSHDIIIRGMKIRTGNEPTGSPRPQRNNLVFKGDSKNPNIGSYNIVVDHCSLSWSCNKILNTYFKVEHVSFTNNFITEPLRSPCSDCLPDHNYGMIIGPGAKFVTVARNIFTHAKYRNPLFGGGGDGGAMLHLQGATYGESVNNIVYNGGNWGNFNVQRNESFVDGDQPQHIVSLGERHLPGSNAAGDYSYVIHDSGDPAGGTNYVHNSSRIYIHGNLTPSRTSQSQSNDAVFANDNVAPSSVVLVDSWPFTKSNVTVSEAMDNYEDLVVNGMDGSIPKVGAYPRDVIDEGVIHGIINKTGGWIDNSPTYPAYDHGTPSTDDDQDGMPNYWEVEKGQDPNNASDAHDDRDSDGYTNLEEYINHFFVSSSSNSILSPPQGFILE